MKLQNALFATLMLIATGTILLLLLTNIVIKNTNTPVPTAYGVSKSLSLNFQILDYFIQNNTLFVYVKPSEPVNASQVFAIVNNRLVNVIPYNSNSVIVDPSKNQLLLIVANLSQIPLNQEGKYSILIGLSNNIIAEFDINYISNPFIDYFKPPTVFQINLSDNNVGKSCLSTYTIPLKLYNTQNIPTPAPFQQQIAICNGTVSLGSNFAYINNATLFNLITLNGSNVYFTTYGTPNIYSWYEGIYTSGSTSCKIWWINISQGIPANSNFTIYMCIDNISTNYYQQYYPYVGLSPQIDPSRKYDNGKYVFIVYGYFNNTFDGWIGYQSPTAVNSFTPVATSSGIQMTNGVWGEATYILPYNNWNIPMIPMIVEEAFYVYYTNEINAISLFGNTSQQVASSSVGSGSPDFETIPNYSTVAENGYYYYWGWYSMIKSVVTNQTLASKVYSSTARNVVSQTIYAYFILNSTYTETGYYFYSSSNVWTPLTLLNMYRNLPLYMSINSTINYNPFRYPTLQISASDGAHSSTQYIQWVVARAYPPNGVMPQIYIG
ncbi:MAG: hypothetical protein ACP5G1_00500 [Nanopusillaceae archaeon]